MCFFSLFFASRGCLHLEINQLKCRRIYGRVCVVHYQRPDRRNPGESAFVVSGRVYGPPFGIEVPPRTQVKFTTSMAKNNI